MSKTLLGAVASTLLAAAASPVSKMRRALGPDGVPWTIQPQRSPEHLARLDRIRATERKYGFDKGGQKRLRRQYA